MTPFKTGWGERTFAGQGYARDYLGVVSPTPGVMCRPSTWSRILSDYLYALQQEFSPDRPPISVGRWT